MPISLPPISRRGFLAGSLAAGIGLLTGRGLGAADAATDPNRFALLADTHVSGQRGEVVRGVNMADNLRQVGSQVIQLPDRPAAMLINGDCAYLAGTAEDYVVLVELLKPLREAGLPVHLALGNHDHRERFWQALTSPDQRQGIVENRHVTVLNAPHANWFILDSLDATNKTPGVLGEQQLAWLAEALDAAREKPALVMTHHNPDDRPQTSGLVDTRKLLDVLEPRKQVKALIFGHTHNWQIREQGGIHLINLPPTAYVFGQDRPNGWIDMQLDPAGAKLQLHALDRTHAEHGRPIELRWRT